MEDVIPDGEVKLDWTCMEAALPITPISSSGSAKTPLPQFQITWNFNAEPDLDLRFSTND